MNPQPQTQPVTDEQLDSLIEAARPNLRNCFRAAIEQHAPVHFFEVAKLPLASGAEWSLVIAVMIEPFAALAGATMLQGMPAMQAAYAKLQKAPETAPLGSGFSVPGT